MTEQNIHLLWDEELDALALKSVLAVLDNMEDYQAHQGGQVGFSETLNIFRNHLLTNGLDSIVSNDIQHTEVENQEELPLFVDEDEKVDDFEGLDVKRYDISDLDPNQSIFDPLAGGMELDESDDDDDDDEADEAESLAEEIRLAEEEAWAENAARDADELLWAEEEAWAEKAERDAEELLWAEEEAWAEKAEREVAEAEAAARLAEEILQAEEEAWIEYGQREDERIRLAEAEALAAYEAELADRANRPSPRSILAHAKSLEEE